MSSKNEFWLILGYVVYNPSVYKPFSVAIHFGPEQPQNLDLYLEEFITELGWLTENGLIIEDRKFEISVMGFINDFPARAFMKRVKGHTGFLWVRKKKEPYFHFFFI